MLVNGAQVAGYRIEGVLGRGGMGQVYEATQLSLGRTVALKVLRAELGADVAFRERFRREGRIQAGLDHPNIVTVHEAGELPDGDGLFLAMRLVRGPTLKELIRAGELDGDRVLALLGPIAAALDAAHAAGLTHRDVKPQNILIGPGDHPYLADFGLTRSGEDTALTRSGAFMGTIDYVAPEIIRGEPASAASDTYALCCVVYECVTGEIPFARETEAAALYAHVNDDPPARAAALGLPEGFDAVVARGMAKDGEDRPQSASELLELFRGALAGEAIAPAPAQPAGGQRTITDEATPGAPTPAAATRAVEPATDSAPGRRGLLAGTAVVVLALAAGAFALGHARTTPAAASLTNVADGPDVGLRAPATWTSLESGHAPAIPGLELSGGVGFASDSPAAGVIAGRSTGAGPTLLPAALRSGIASDPLHGEPVMLGDHEALRYRDVRVRGFDRLLTLYAVPVSSGVATVACYAPDGAPSRVARDCERVAASLRLRRGKVLPVKPDAAVAARITRTLASLDRDRGAASRRLHKAKTRDGQAAAATSLAAAYAAAALDLGGLAVSPAIAPAIDAMAAAARSAARANGDLASAASSGDASAYASAARRARHAHDALVRRTAVLTAAGYRVG